MPEERKMQLCCVHAMHHAVGRDAEKTRGLLTAYFSSPKGKAELANSPHRNRPVAEFVEDLLREVRDV